MWSNVPQLFYPCICQWTSRLFPYPVYCKYCCSEHWSTCVFQNSLYVLLYYSKYFIFEWLCHLVFFFSFIYLEVLVVAHRIFVAASRLLSSCGTWTPERPGSADLAPSDLVAPRHVGSQFPHWGLNLHTLHWKVDS